MQELTKEVAARLKLSVQQGVIVTDVADNSMAAAQDIQREDVITEVDGKPVTSVASFRAGPNESRSAPRHSALPRSKGQPHFCGAEGRGIRTPFIPSGAQRGQGDPV